jgi:hypothetical protein
MARRSVVGRRREIADSAHADIRRRYQSLWSLATALCAGNSYPVTSLVAQVACAPNESGTLDPGAISQAMQPIPRTEILSDT